MDQKNVKMEQKKVKMDQKNVKMEQKNAKMEQMNVKMDQKGSGSESKQFKLNQCTSKKVHNDPKYLTEYFGQIQKLQEALMHQKILHQDFHSPIVQ